MPGSVQIWYFKGIFKILRSQHANEDFFTIAPTHLHCITQMHHSNLRKDTQALVSLPATAILSYPTRVLW